MMALYPESKKDRPFSVVNPAYDLELVVRDESRATLPTRPKWYQYFSPTDTPAERRLILKLDGLIIIFVFLAY